MQLRYDQLAAHLAKQSLAPVYLLSGAEPMLLEECQRAIHAAAIKQDYNEKQIWQVETGFSWQELLMAANSLSLFSHKEILELRCSSNQLNETAGKNLQIYFNAIPPDKILLIVTDKLTAQQQKSAWYQTLAKIGVVMLLWPLEGQALLTWLKQRLAAVNLTTSAEGLQLLAERSEGNLLAVAQEIEKLSLLYPKTNLTLEMLTAAVTDNARFDVFSLSDALLLGNSKRIIQILTGLREESVEPILILWAITKEIRTLTTIAELLALGITIDKALQEQRVWEKRKTATCQAVQKHKLANWHQLLQHAAHLDKIIKGIMPGNIWDELTTLCLKIAGGVPFNFLTIMTLNT